MSEVRQCWAYSVDGVRCEHPAGHPGNHAVEITWTDEECATPGKPVQVPVPPPPPSAEAPQVRSTNKCVACGHPHKGACPSCGCYEFIG